MTSKPSTQSSKTPPPASPPASSPTTAAAQPQIKGSRLGNFIRRHFFNEQNVGLASAKQISQTWDTNINKIVQFIDQKEYIIRYSLMGLGVLGVGFLYFKFKSLGLERRLAMERYKALFINKKLVNDVFRVEDHFSNNNFKVLEGKLATSECSDYQRVLSYYSLFRKKTDNALVVIGPTGSGKTEMMRNIFKQLRKENRMVAYVDLEQSHRRAENISDILIYQKQNPIYLKKLLDGFSDQVLNPVVLLDNLQHLVNMEHSERILADLQYYRRTACCTLLLASTSDIRLLDTILKCIKFRWNGPMEEVFYKRLVEKLELGSVERNVLLYKPNLYQIQELVQSHDKQGTWQQLIKREKAKTKIIDTMKLLGQFNQQTENKLIDLKLLRVDVDGRKTGDEFSKNISKLQ